MNVLWYYAIGFIIIWILAFLLKDKYDISIDGFVLMLKTDKLEHIISKIASNSPRFWKYFINLSIPLGIFFMILMVVSLIISLKLMFNTPTVSLILPGVDMPGSPLYVPLFTGFVALSTVLIVHEGGHGVLARAENVSIDSVGLLLALIIPGAFVEPNEEDVKKINGFSRIRIYFAGPMFNIALCIIALLITSLIGGFIVSEDLYTSDGMQIDSVIPGSPASSILSESMVIQSVNNYTVNNYSSYVKSLNGTKIGDNLTFKTDKGTYSLITSKNPNNGSQSYIGIRAEEHKVVSSNAKEKYGNFIPSILPTINEIFYYIFLLNFAVGTFNLLPMKPLDGGLILEEILNIKIRDDRRLDFNKSFNKYIGIFPNFIRLWLNRRFNDILNFIHYHELDEEKTQKATNLISQVLLFILILLVVYGFAPVIKAFI